VGRDPTRHQRSNVVEHLADRCIHYESVAGPTILDAPANRTCVDDADSHYRA
jgi:hypothetical protein